MAEQTNKRKRPSVGFYGEPGFVSLTTSLRKLSGDDTIPTDNYVDIYKDLYDLITPDTIKSGVSDITLSTNKRKLVIFYVDGTQKKLPLDDYVISNIYFDKISKKAYFVFTNGEKVELDLNDLYETFATKEEVNVEINVIKEELSSVTENIITIREEIPSIIETKFQEEVTTLIEEKFEKEIETIIDNKINEEIEVIIENKINEEIDSLIDNKLEDGVTNIKWVNF